jgi:hypothetical protein
MDIVWTLLIAVVLFIIVVIPDWFGEKTTASDRLALMGAVTGTVAISVTVIKELIRDKPSIKVYEVYQDKEDDGGVIRRYQ